MPFAPVAEIVEYCCSECGGNKWQLHISQQAGQKTTLLTLCANQECVKQRRLKLAAGPHDLIVWDEFDITGQGYDAFATSSHTEDDSEVN